MKIRLSDFSGLKLLNMIPPQEQVLLGFTAACSPTVGADVPISVQQCQAQIPLQPPSSPGAVIPKWALSEQK